jgi:choice-of-anchor A domain-containing protein/uncharacterized repeat protein (TIGR01451 family)/uncharacterized repeat protein (TIGR02543 family)
MQSQRRRSTRHGLPANPAGPTTLKTSSLFMLVTAALLLGACGAEPEASDSMLPEELTLGHVKSPLVTNGDFESGTLTGWTVDLYTNRNGLRVVPPISLADLDLSSGGTNQSSAVGGATESQIPAGLSSRSSLRYPKYDQWSAVINRQGASQRTNGLRQTFPITNADVDPADGKVHIRFALAPVLEDPGHSARDQPYYFVLVHNVTKGRQLFSTFAYSNQPGVPWKMDPSTGVLYTDWQIYDVAPGSALLDVGDRVEINIIAAGCSLGGHYGHVYVDSFGAFLPGMSIAASAPTQANAGSNLTYTYLVKNSGKGAATNVIVTQPLPANTTFVGVNLPGATCTTPPVGAAGTVTCNLGTINPTASATFQMTVRINPSATGTINNGSYTVHADGVAPLIGPLVVTTVTQGVVFADLAITKSDGVAAVTWGQPVQYTLEVTNHGPAAVTGARVTDTMPAQLTAVTWTCTASAGGACPVASGSGNINTTVNLPANAQATITVKATIVSGSGSGSVTNVASVAAPTGVTDNDPTDNQAADTNSIGNLYQLTVNKAPTSTGTGRVVTSPAAIDCDAACASASSGFRDGTLVSVTATASPGHTFAGWTGACIGSANPCNFVVTADTVLTARFTSPKAPNGGPCAVGSDCLSGACVDGVCCNTLCTDQCMACNVAGSVGTCSPVTGAPVGGRPACNSDGSVCGGSCDGSSPSCSYPGSSTQCRNGTCSGNVETHPAFCSGTGSCPAPSTATCSPFVCGPNACLTSCTTVADCSTGNYCSDLGQCLFDTEPPVLVLPANMVLEGTSPAGATAHFTATATDAVVGSLPVTCSAASGGTFPLGTTTVTCSANDGHGNVATGLFTITVVDTTPPVLTVVGTNPLQLECGTAYVDAGATASDICSGDLTSAIVTTHGVNSSVVGTYTVDYTVADLVGLTASGQRVVDVQDTLAPVIHMNPGPSVLECYGAPYVDPGATAADICSGDLTSSITVTSNLDQSRAGDYQVVYSVGDAAGHERTVVRNLTVGSCCFNIRLSDYNVFLLENYTGGHDIEGKVAAGGDISMTDFSVGIRVPASNLANTLVAGGNLTLSRGAVHGDARYGNSYSAGTSVVYPRGAVAQGTPIDFAARFAELRNLSSRLGRVPANGTTRRETWGGIYLSGAHSTLNVFDLNAGDLTGAKLFDIHAPAGSLAVVNIRGGSASLSGFSFTFSGGIDQRGVLFNFVNASSIDAKAIGIRGTVLAPHARVTFSNGSFNGGIYAVSLTGNAEGHVDPLNDRDVCP